MATNKLYYGDNLDVLRQHVSAGTVDLIYLDPPFNSNRNYNVIFNRHDVTGDEAAQIQAFDDTWRWTPITEQQYSSYINGELPSAVADALSSFRTLLGENDAMAYLVNMAPRLVELHRVLKPSGSLYLHCDPTMSHYLKVMLDAVFGGGEYYRNEIIWSYGGRGAKAVAKQFPRNHDIVFLYTRSPYAPYTAQYVDKLFTPQEARARGFRVDTDGRWFKTAPRGDYTDASIAKLETEGRIHWTRTGKARVKYFLPVVKGQVVERQLVGDVWTDIPDAMHMGAERLGYPTQKPVALLERILSASSKPGDLVLDPFCGCGTTVDAAVRLDRRWIGIDITYIAVDLIEKRITHTHGSEVRGTYEVLGIPRDRASALALFNRSSFDFERWAVSLVNAQPNQKQVGDKGIDGVARFPLDAQGSVGRVLISVKGGRQLNPSMVRDLGGTVATQKAEMGVLITNAPPTRGMVDEANHAGSYQHPNYIETFPRIQLITVDELLSGKRPRMPATMSPYIQALRAKTPADQESLFDD